MGQTWANIRLSYGQHGAPLRRSQGIDHRASKRLKRRAGATENPISENFEKISRDIQTHRENTKKPYKKISKGRTTETRRRQSALGGKAATRGSLES